MARVATTRKNDCPVCRGHDLRMLHDYGDGRMLHCGGCASLLFRRNGDTEWAGEWKDGADLEGVELIHAAQVKGLVPVEDQAAADREWALNVDIDSLPRTELTTEQEEMIERTKSDRKMFVDAATFKSIRRKLHMTQRQYAIALGLATSTGDKQVSRWELRIHRVPRAVMAFARHLEHDYLAKVKT